MIFCSLSFLTINKVSWYCDNFDIYINETYNGVWTENLNNTIISIRKAYFNIIKNSNITDYKGITI